MQAHPDSPRLANKTMVLGSGGTVSRPSKTATTNSLSAQITTEKPIPLSPRIPQPPCMVSRSTTLQNQGFTAEVADRIAAPQRLLYQNGQFFNDGASKNRWNLVGCYTIPELKVERIGLVQRQDVVMFHGRFCPFSNFYPCEFVVSGIKYNCVKQYFQKKRADYSGTLSYSLQISHSSDPAEMKAINKPLEKSFWPEELQYNAMKEALLAKFQQNDRLRSLLKDTDDRTVIECNKYDTYWGNGHSIFHKEARYGTGQNKL